MTKIAKCYRSFDDTRRPTCRRFTAGLCGLCSRADLRYRARKEEMMEVRKARNRASAARSRVRRNRRWDDLVVKNSILQQRDREADEALKELEVEKRKLIAAINGKVAERDWRVDCVANDVSEYIMLDPGEAILQLCNALGCPVPMQQEVQGGATVLDATSAAEPEPLKSCSCAGNNSEVSETN